MGTLRNWGMGFVLATLKDLRLATLHVPPFAYTLWCLCQCISERVERQSAWKKWNFEREQIVGARLAGASVTKTATLLGVSRATVSKVISAYTNHGKTTSAKRNSGRKLHWEELIRKSQNYCSTGDRSAELNIRLEEPVSTKTVRSEFYKPNIHGRAAIAKPQVTESNAQMRKRGCHDNKTWTSGNWKRVLNIVRW
jgi:predicted transcriptional regulator